MDRSEVYKTPCPHEVGVPRTGDLAEVRRGHCRANSEAGLLCQVVGEPHWCYCLCADCGQEVTDWFVEVGHVVEDVVGDDQIQRARLQG